MLKLLDDDLVVDDVVKGRASGLADLQQRTHRGIVGTLETMRVLDALDRLAGDAHSVAEVRERQLAVLDNRVQVGGGTAGSLLERFDASLHGVAFL